MKPISNQFLLPIICCFLFHFSFGQQTTVNFTTPFVNYNIHGRGNEVLIATQGGVEKINITNGQKKFYTAANSPIAYNEVDAVLIDRSGNYWFGNITGLTKYEDNQWTKYYALPSGDTIKSVSKLKQDVNGKVYCMNPSNIFVFDSTNITVVHAIQLTGQAIYDFDVDSSGNIWMASDDKLVKYDGVNTTNYDSVSCGIPARIFNVGVDKNGIVWVRGANSNNTLSYLYKFDGITWTQITGGLVSNAIGRKMYIGEDGNKYFNPINDTAYKYNDTTWTALTASNGQIATYTNNMFVDTAGNIYSMTIYYNDSLVRYDGTNTSYFDARGYNFDCNYFKNCFIGDDNLIYACNSYGIVVTNGINFSTIARPTTSYLQWIKKDNFGNIWAITENGSPCYLAKYNGTTWTTYNVSSYGVTGYTLEVTPNGIVYMGATDGLLKFDGTTFTKYVLNDPYSGSNPRTVFNMSIDTAGNVWIPDWYSLVKFNGTTYSFYSNYPAIIPYNTSGGIYGDKNGNIWFDNFINQSSSLAKFDGTNYTIYSDTNSAFPSDWGLWNISEDDDGILYIGTARGLITFDGTQFGLFNYLYTGFGCNGIGSVVKENNGNIWFTSVTDLGIFNPNGIRNIEIEPKNAITGNVFFDQNQDGIKDTIDVGLPNQLLMMQPDSMYRFTNSNGDYKFFSNTGSVVVNKINNSGWHLTSDSANFSVYVDSILECCYDFGTYPDSVIHDMQVSISNSAARCHRVVPVWMNVYNNGTVPENVKAFYILDSLTSFASSTPDTSYTSGDTLFWSYNNTPPFDLNQIVAYIQMPNDSLVGSPIKFTSGIIDSATAQLLDFEQITDTLKCAIDPNDKSVVPYGVTSNHYTLFSDTLVYTIRFQNTGNDTAHTVSIYDTLSSAIDISTFKFIASSHSFDVQYDSQGRMRFKAENIMLPDSGTNQLLSQGFVKFSVQSKNGLPELTPVKNTAYIYFDFNFPVVTNTTLNTLVSQLNVSVSKGNNINGLRVFPNPSNDMVTFNLENEKFSNARLKLFDLKGRLVLQKTFKSNRTLIDLREQNTGMFFYEVSSDANFYRGKIIIQK